VVGINEYYTSKKCPGYGLFVAQVNMPAYYYLTAMCTTVMTSWPLLTLEGQTIVLTSVTSFCAQTIGGAGSLQPF
jgi:hypothetical protein